MRGALHRTVPSRRGLALSGPIAAVVLAGGAPDAVSAAWPDAPNKAFVPIAGRALVTRTLDALRASPRVGRILVVAPRVAHRDASLRGAHEMRDAGATMASSLRAGLRDLPPDDPVLVTASDLPVLSVAALDEFLTLAARGDADVVYACVERRTHVARFPGVPHTWARLRDGTYCGGGVVAIRPRALARLETFLGRLGAARKNPLRLAAIFGAPTLLRYAIGRLSVADAERRGSALVGIALRAAVCTHPEIAVNVDRPSDVALATALVTASRRT